MIRNQFRRLSGLVLFILGYPLIVSVWSIAVLPITLLVYGGLRTYQSRHVFGYLAFLLGYQMLCSPASIAGYTQHVI